MRLRTTVWRAHHPRWSFAPASGEGAAAHGGRFNAVGRPALYTSLRPETAWLEAQQGFAFKAQPMTVCGYDVDCEAVVDLTDSATLRDLAIDPAVLGCAWEDLASRGQTPPSWRLADRLIAEKVAGIVVPSYAAGSGAIDRNVVFWLWTDDLPHRVRVIDDHQHLPLNDLSWR